MQRELIAILRGITPEEVIAAAQILIDAGILMIEVPLNSPDALTSIEILTNEFGNSATIGAGTVLEVAEVERLAQIGAKLIVSPNMNPEIIKATKSANMLSFPGVMTPTECFKALEVGADGLKFFPGELVGPAGLKAMRAVLPKTAKCYGVGGASPANFAQWKAAGVDGFGIGSALYKSGMNQAQIKANAEAIIKAYDEVM